MAEAPPIRKQAGTALYPIVYLDCIHVKARDSGAVRVKAVYLALGINLAGEKELLGIWIAQTEGAKFWLQVVTELKNRGVADIFIACVDGLKGFPEAIEAVFPKAQVQLCIVHMVRHSLRYVSWKQRKEVAEDLKSIYNAPTVQQAETNLTAFAKKWDASHPTISKSWRNNWERIIPLFSYPPEIRKAIYTTNAIESLNMSLRKVTKNRGSFPNDEAMTKLLYLAMKNISKKWTLRLCRAMTEDEQAAVGKVVRLFFTVDGEGNLHNKKADEIIAENREFVRKAEEAGRKGSAKRWGKANPVWNPVGNPIANPIGNPMQTPIASTTTTNTKEGGPESARPDMDFIFTDGLDSLLAGGLNEREARAVLGRMVKDFGEPETAAALAAAIGKADVKSYAMAILSKRKKEARNEKRFVI